MRLGESLYIFLVGWSLVEEAYVNNAGENIKVFRDIYFYCGIRLAAAMLALYFGGWTLIQAYFICLSDVTDICKHLARLLSDLGLKDS